MRLGQAALDFDRLFVREDRRLLRLATAGAEGLRSGEQATVGFFAWCEIGGRAAAGSCDSEEELPDLLARLRADFLDLCFEAPAARFEAPELHLREHAGRRPDSAPLGQRAAFVRDLRARTRRGRGIAGCTLEYADMYRTVTFWDGPRAAASYDQACVEVAGAVLFEDGSRMSVRAGAFDAAALERFEGAIEGRLARRAAVQAELPRTPELPVVLSEQAAAVFAHECLGHPLEADEPSCLDAFADGRPGGWNKELTVVDDGSLSHMSGYCPIDDEGVLGGATRLVERGRIVGRLHSRETARAAGARPTGNARAVDARFAPIVRSTNTLVSGGTLGDGELFDGIPLGVFVEEVHDAASGRAFAMSVRSARLIRDGRVGPAVRVTSVGGDLVGALRSLEGIGAVALEHHSFRTGCGKRDQLVLPVGMRAPKLRFRRLEVRA